MPRNSPPVAVYEYRTARGRIAFEKRRYVPKRFAYHWPNGERADGSDVPPLLYRLPELIAADRSEIIYVVEGEKDVDRLRSLGLIATCNYDGGGRGKWLTNYAQYFRGRDVVIIPDNDRTGRTHAVDAASKLMHVAISVRILNLPGLEAKGDVSDWLDAGHRFSELTDLLKHARVWRQEIELETRHFDSPYEWRDMIQHILRRDLSAQEKLLLIVLQAKIVMPNPTQPTIGRALSLSPGRVKKMIAKLKRDKVLSSHRTGRINSYFVR